MSESLRPEVLGEAWGWLHPEHVWKREELGTRLWPDLGPAGREQARELLQGAQRGLMDDEPPAPASLRAGQRASARRMLERELRGLLQPPGRGELAELAAGALGPAGLVADPDLVRERLERLDELVAPLRNRGRLDLGGDRDEGRRGAARLRAVARHLEQRLPRLQPDQPRPGLEGLLSLAAELEAAPPRELPREPEAWRQLDEEGGWPLSQLLERVESELADSSAELEKRAETLRLRYLGPGPHSGPARPWLQEQFALDPSRPEHWAWLHTRHLQDISRHLRSLGLEHEAVPALVLPGWEAAGPESDPAGHFLALPDLSVLDPTRLQALLAEFHHGALPVQAAREGLPGRLWLLRRWRGQVAPDPESAVLATLLRLEDLDLWARWAGSWLPRTGWLAGDTRLRLLTRQAEWRDLGRARADLELRLGIRPQADIRRRLESECGLPTPLAEAAWRSLLAEPGRQALASARLFDLQEAGRRWRRQQRGGGADLFWLTADSALLPGPWLRTQFAAQPADGRQWAPLPPALVRPTAHPELLGEVEERLAALGRIRREDLEAGREFDSTAPAGALETADTVQPDPDGGEESGAAPE